MAFEALWVERSVTRGGRRLGLSQPAMSGTLARLRATFGDELFVRGKSGLAPTERCAELAPPVVAALAELRRAFEARPFDAATSDRTFVIGSVDAAIAVVLPGVVRRVSERAPRVRLSVVTLDPEHAAARVESGELDLALAPVPTAPASVAARALFSIGLRIVMRAGHPLAHRALELEHFGQYPSVIVSFRGTSANPLDRTLAEHGASRRVVAAVDSFLAVPYFLASSDAIATLPSPFARALEATGAFVCRDLPAPIPRGTLRMRLLWSEQQSASAASRWLRAVVVEAAREAVGE